MVDRRKPRPYSRDRAESYRDGILFVIATEGEKTEKQYFDGMFVSRRYQVRTIGADRRGKSSPKHVLQRIDEFKKEYEFENDDEFWLVIDVDRWKQQQISYFVKEALKKGCKLAVSNPCFELFLYLHTKDMSEEESGKEYKAKDMKKMAQSTGAVNERGDVRIENLKGKEKLAVKRARKMDENSSHRWPRKTGTHVYKLVDKLIENI